jgi:hypothetical protein
MLDARNWSLRAASHVLLGSIWGQSKLAETLDKATIAVFSAASAEEK